MKVVNRFKLFSHQRRFISSNSSFIFVDDRTAIPVSSIGTIKNVIYTKEFKNKYNKLSGVNFEENVIYIKRIDSWYHWITETENPKLYNELALFIKNGYYEQINNNLESKIDIHKKNISSPSKNNSFKYEPYRYKKD